MRISTLQVSSVGSVDVFQNGPLREIANTLASDFNILHVNHRIQRQLTSAGNYGATIYHILCGLMTLSYLNTLVKPAELDEEAERVQSLLMPRTDQTDPSPHVWGGFYDFLEQRTAEALALFRLDLTFALASMTMDSCSVDLLPFLVNTTVTASKTDPTNLSFRIARSSVYLFFDGRADNASLSLVNAKNQIFLILIPKHQTRFSVRLTQKRL